MPHLQQLWISNSSQTLNGFYMDSHISLWSTSISSLGPSSSFFNASLWRCATAAAATGLLPLP
eukprot:846383-Karenia_brevis.AAC.1